MRTWIMLARRTVRMLTLRRRPPPGRSYPRIPNSFC
jgi:hypothetical protein